MDKNKFFKPQKIMRKVIWALVPTIFGSVYFFGWRSLASIAVACVVGFLTEYLINRRINEPVSEAVFVTCVLFALVMPPHVPWTVLIVGVVFACFFAKGVFGGFGRNVFNPAIAGRAFVYISFPVALTSTWPQSAPLGGWGALGKWTTAVGPDAIAAATPMSVMKAGGPAPDIFNLLFGGISGTMGVTSAVLISIGGIYLFYKKIASRTTILSLIITYAVWSQALTWAGVEGLAGAIPAILGGGFLFGAFYMATDPVSSPKTKEAKIFYGMIIGTGTAVIRTFSIFNGGLMFSILLGNMFAPILDHLVRENKKRNRLKAQMKQEGAV